MDRHKDRDVVETKGKYNKAIQRITHSAVIPNFVKHLYYYIIYSYTKEGVQNAG